MTRATAPCTPDGGGAQTDTGNRQRTTEGADRATANQGESLCVLAVRVHVCARVPVPTRVWDAERS